MLRRLKGRIVEMFGTQSDFADKLGINESIVSRVVRGRKRLTAEEVEEWAEALAIGQEDFEIMQSESNSEIPRGIR
jgi:transcriptional regulator with XRE-family HTH domain